MAAIDVKLQRLIDFFANGVAADTRHYDPEDVATQMALLNAQLQDGLSSKHLASNAVDTSQLADEAVTADKLAEGAVSGAKLVAGFLRMLPFTGVDGSGEEPDLSCTLTGALAGDTVAALLDTADFSDQRAKFESAISAAGHIEQVELADLSAKTYLILLIKE